jgi:hypothetical protein
MPKYQVRFGEVLPHDGRVLEGGAIVELPRAVADDSAVRGLVQEVDDAGQPVTPVAASDLDRFRTHERVTVLRERLAEAEGVATAIRQQLAAEEQRLVDEVAALSATKAAAAVEAPAPAPTPKAVKDKDKQPAKGQES